MYNMIVHFPKNEPVEQLSEGQNKTAVALGKFDGIHIGHQKLIRELTDTARDNGLLPVVLLIRTKAETIEEKKEQINRLFCYGVKAVAELELTPEVKNMSAECFLNEVLIRELSMNYLLGGTDVAFGHERTGNADFLKKKASELGFRYKLIDKILLNGTACREDGKRTISSTLLRQKIQSGDMESVRSIMGEYYSITGTVHHGRHIGTDVLGVPTLNQAVETNRYLPPNGVYISKVRLLPDENHALYYGISNLGVKPSIENGTDPLTLETHLLDCPPSTDLYGKNVKTELLHFIRPEMKFDSMEELGRQLREKDIPEALKHVERIKKQSKKKTK